MFIPPYDALLSALNVTKEDVANKGKVEVPKELFELLARLALSAAPFDEPDYLTAYPDIRDAVKAKNQKSGRSHFLMWGYFEGRVGGTAMVDEEWYLQEYPDVAQAIKSGAVGSATEHYKTGGMYEWRAPNAEAKRDMILWKRALGQ